jgi:hypothetical protein
MNYTEQLKNSFLLSYRNSDGFNEWLWHSNSAVVKSIKDNMYLKMDLDQIYLEDLPKHQEDVLEQILDILKREPNADYFWFNYTGELTYTLPSNEVQVVPGDSIRVDKEKTKSLLREIKLNEIGI